MKPIAVFAYGSIVGRESIGETLGREVPQPIPARLANWRRRWSLVRDNARSEKGFEPLEGEPFDFCLGLNLEPAPGLEAADWPNGALVELNQAELERLDRRELRYDRLEVTPHVRTDRPHPFAAVYAYRAKPEHFAAQPPPRSVVLASYLQAVEAAFADLGEREAAAFARTTEPPGVPVVEARLTRDEIPRGNPRAW